MTTQQWIDQGSNAIMKTYNRYPLVVASGKGRTVVDSEGKEYLDFMAGVAVNALGYGDPDITRALEQVLASGVLHCSNYYWNPQAITAAEKLRNLAQMDKVFFCNSGAEANEAGLKLARKFGHQHGENRSHIITMKYSFHGRTYGAITATGQEKYHAQFDPLLPGFSYAQFNDLDDVKSKVTDKTCAILVEPIQGEGGIIPATQEFLEGLRSLCDAHNLLLLFDEVQCGMGRCGAPFAWQTYGVQPDAMALAKALGVGVPIGALVVSEKVSHLFQPGDHASTFGGNPLACAAANVILDRLLDKDFCSQVEQRGSQLMKGLHLIQETYPEKAVAVRGKGLMVGIQLTVSPAEAVKKCMEKGLLVVSAGYDVLRFVPPLTVTMQEIDRALAIVEEVIAAL